eukprot:scaffold38130_cov62-Phaeocystis_antarctica.AAC.1
MPAERGATRAAPEAGAEAVAEAVAVTAPPTHAAEEALQARHGGATAAGGANPEEEALSNDFEALVSVPLPLPPAAPPSSP